MQIDEKIKEKIVFFALAGLVLIGAYLRLFGLSDWYQSPDNIMAIIYPKEAQNLAELVKYIYLDWWHPPFIYVLLYFLLPISAHPLVFTSIAWLPSLLTIIIGYFIGLKAGGRIAGLFIAITVTFSYFFIVYSQITRSYTFYVLFISVMLWCFLSFVEKPHKKYILIYLCSATLAIFSHYTAFIPIGAFGIAWLISSLIQYVTSKDRSKKYISIYIITAHILLGIIFSAQSYIKLNAPDLIQKSALQEWVETNKVLHHTAQRQVKSRYEDMSSFNVDVALKQLEEKMPILQKKLVNLTNSFFFGSNAKYPYIFLIAICTGIILSLFAGKWYVPLLFLILLLVSTLADLSGLYSFGANRRNAFYIPILLWLSAFGFQYIYSYKNKALALLLFGVFFFFSATNWVYSENNNILDHDSLRRHARHYFRIKESDLKQAAEVLKDIPKNDTIIENKTIFYARMHEKFINQRQISFSEDKTYSCLYSMTTFTPKNVRKCLKKFTDELSTANNIWLVGISDFRGKMTLTNTFKRCYPVKKIITYETFKIIVINAKESLKNLSAKKRCWK